MDRSSTQNARSILEKLWHLARLIGRFLRVQAKQSPFLTKSLILHFILLVAISGLLPTCAKKLEKPKVISVSIVPMQVAEVPEPKVQKPKPVIIKQPKKEPPKPKEEKPKEVKPKKVGKPKPKPVEKKKKEEVVEKKKSEVPTLKKEEVKKKPEKEKPKPKEEKPKDKKQEAAKEQEGKKSLLKDLEKKESIDEIFEKIEEVSKKAKPETKSVKQIPKKETTKTEPKFVPDVKFVKEIMGIVQGQISECWSIPIGAKDVQDMAVTLYIKLDKKGNVKIVKITDKAKYNSDNFYRVLADSAVWAVKECSPLSGLPEDKHEFWKEIEFTFNPASVL